MYNFLDGFFLITSHTVEAISTKHFDKEAHFAKPTSNPIHVYNPDVVHSYLIR